MRKIIMFIVVAGLMIGCQQGNKTAENSKNGFYGEEFETTETISVAELKSKLDDTTSVEGLVVSGTIEDVCQAKGCWLTLKAENDEPVRVTFKDYGFFVPKDVAGKEVVVKGMGKIETTSVEDLKHFAGDEGQSEEEIAKITEPLDEYVFVAEGVQIK